MKRQLTWIITIVLIGAAGVAAYYYFYVRGARDKGPTYETVLVDRGPVVAQLMATGNLSPLVTVQVGSQVSGRISHLAVDFNSVVKKGQVIAKIDPQIFQAAVEQSRANQLSADAGLVKARVQLAEAERQFKRTTELASRKLVATADEDTARANFDAAKAQVVAAQAAVAQARATLNQTRINLAYTTIFSPIDGVVISRNVDVGQTVAASLQAPTLFTIAEDLAKMQVHASVAEADIGRIREGMEITFGVDAYTKERFKGLIWQIRNSPQTVQNVVTYDVVVNVDNSDLRLKPGMTANVTFVYAEASNVLRAANAALRFRPPAALLARSKRHRGGSAAEGVASAATTASGREKQEGQASGRGKREGQEKKHREHREARKGGSASSQPSGLAPDQRHVWVLRDGVPRQVTIRVGISDGTRTVILDGPVEQGDELIINVLGDLDKGSGPAKGGLFGPPRGKGGAGHGRGVVRHI
jgi:HlyD family secretion protein